MFLYQYVIEEDMSENCILEEATGIVGKTKEHAKHWIKKHVHGCDFNKKSKIVVEIRKQNEE